MNGSANPAAPSYGNKEPKMATAKKTTKPKKTAPARKSTPGRESPASPGKGRQPAVREKLTALKPSGGKDESFFDLVHEIARQVPRGRVTSYGAIAACLGSRSSARVVGWAMQAVHSSKKPVPAHRVVNSSGLLTGSHHFKPAGSMQARLEKEGVRVVNNKVVDFSKVFWDPSKEL